MQTANELCREEVPSLFEDACLSKVGDFERAVIGEKEILKAEIPMANTLRVTIGEPVEEEIEIVAGEVLIERFVGEIFVKRSAAAEFHDEKDGVFGLDDVLEMNDMWMSKHHHGLNLNVKPAHIADISPLNGLDGTTFSGLGVDTTHDGAVAALSEDVSEIPDTDASVMMLL